MLQIIKRYFSVALLVAGLQTSWGFALLGPFPPAGSPDSWESAVLGYNYASTIFIDVQGGPMFLGDIGTPKNIAEEYRRNVPVMYYTYDQTFLNYFGTDGAAEVDGAYSIMNSIPSADKVDLSLYPLESMHFNYTAQADYLTDIKSITLHLLVEQMGLSDPARFVWTLHERLQFLPPICPDNVAYLVVQRNLDYLSSSVNQVQYSSYINDVLYSYIILENCVGPLLAVTVTFPVDPEASAYSAVASNNQDGSGTGYLGNSVNQPTSTSGGLQIGSFYSGLTRDDVAGLKYLFRTNNVNLELPDPTSLLFSVTTNLNLQQLFPSSNGTNNAGTNGFGFYVYDGNFGYGDYGWLMAASQTNSPAVMQALYPGLIISSSSNYFVVATNYTYTQYFTNSGAGTVYPPPLKLVTITNRTRYLLEKFVTKFANVFPDKVSTTTQAKLQTISVVPNSGAPYPAPPVTNTTTQLITLNNPSGDFFLLPMFHTNVCPLNLLYKGLTNVVAITNFLTATSTNIVTTTNTASYGSTMMLITYFTSYTWVGHPVTCAEVPNAANLYQGIGGSKFVRADYDSLIGQFFQPVTNYYSMVALTNSQWVPQRFVRVVTRPDFIMDAADLGEVTVLRSNPNFIPSPIVNGLAGPGTIATPTTFTYTKMGDAFWNGYFLNTASASTNGFLGELGQIHSLAWASFDASTNAPELYPNGTSIQNLEAILAVGFSPRTPPDGYIGSSYSQTFTINSGLQLPFIWSASSGGISGLPPGMTVTTASNRRDFILSGTPTSSGTFDFVLQLSDATGRSVQWNFTIIIH